MPARDEAEGHFETYLRSRGIEFEYEKPAGPKHPDYWLKTESGPVVCEVHHVTASMSDLPSPSGAFDPYKPLARGIKRKAAQGRPLEDIHPYVVVIWAPHWVDDGFAVMGALFGKVQVVMPFDPATGTAQANQAHLGFGRDATLHADAEDGRSHISAVAVLRRFNPGLRAAQDEVDDLLAKGANTEDRLTLTLEVYGRRGAEGVLDDDQRQPRLVTYHNIYASLPLRPDVFDGPFDEQFSLTQDHYEKVMEGPEVRRLPR